MDLEKRKKKSYLKEKSKGCCLLKDLIPTLIVLQLWTFPRRKEQYYN